MWPDGGLILIHALRHYHGFCHLIMFPLLSTSGNHIFIFIAFSGLPHEYESFFFFFGGEGAGCYTFINLSGQIIHFYIT